MLNSQIHPHIPPHAKKVFSGVRADIYQWEQELYDGRIVTFERTRFTDGVFTIPILKNGKILLTRQSQPAREDFISLAGGGLDLEDSTPLDGAKRELLEETGAISDDWHHWTDFLGTVNTATYVYYFIARDCEIVSHINPDGGEKIELFEVTFDEFLELSSNKKFHHHWNLLPILYEARLNKQKYKELYNLFYN